MRKVVVLFIVLLAADFALASTINTTDAKTVRKDTEHTDVLNFLDVKKGTEDRTILEFDVHGLSGTEPSIMLNIWFDNIDPELPIGILDIFAFVCDGVVTIDDYYAGGTIPFVSFIAENGPEYGYVSINVTSVIQTAITMGEQFVGFRLSTETDDRFSMGWPIDLPNPILTVIPEPATVCLLAIGGVMLRRRSSFRPERTQWRNLFKQISLLRPLGATLGMTSFSQGIKL